MSLSRSIGRALTQQLLRASCVHPIVYDNLKHLYLVHHQQADQVQRSTAAANLQPLKYGRGGKAIEEKRPLHKLPRGSCWGMLLHKRPTEYNGQS